MEKVLYCLIKTDTFIRCYWNPLVTMYATPLSVVYHGISYESIVFSQNTHKP